MTLCDGRLIYSLNAPYIHLSVADTVLHGAYGLNLLEAASPSSSILYPLLLALTEWLGLGEWGPLLLNVLAMSMAVYGAGRIIQDHVLLTRPGPLAFGPSALALALSMCLLMNSWALVMTGLEHSLHVMTVVLLLWGVLQVIDHGASARWVLLLSLVAMPLIRFEGMALALAGLLVLAGLRQGRAAVQAGLALLLFALIWYACTRHLGLHALPCSVLLRSGSAAQVLGQSHGASWWASLRASLNNTLAQRQGRMLLSLSALLLLLSLDNFKRGQRALALSLGGLGLCAALAHVGGGQYGKLPRYEIYVLTLLALSCLVLGRRYLARPRGQWLAAAGLLFIAWPYLSATLITPQATRAIYLMPYQLHRFGADYWQQPLASNEIGWLSYRNPNYVLDLEGLGSETVCRLRLAGAWNQDSMAALIARRNIAMIIVTSTSRQGAPLPLWRKLAELTATLHGAGQRSIRFYASFYLRPGDDPAAARQRLRRFGASLPSGAQLQIP